MSIWTWIKNLGHHIKIDVTHIVVPALQLLQGLEDDGLLPGIAKLLDSTTGHLSTEINAVLQKAIIAGIAVGLGIEGLPDNPTPQQVLDFSNAAVAALAGKKKLGIKGEAITHLGIQLYNTITGIIDADKLANVKVTYGQIGKALEDTYQQLQQTLADIAAGKEDTTV